MIDIYSKNTEFEPNEILDQMAKIDREIEAERGKDDNEYNRE